MKIFRSHSILYLLSLLFVGLQLASCENSEYSPELVPGLSPVYVTATKTTFNVSAEKQDVQTEVKASGVSWSFTDIASWITASPSSGSSDAAVTFSVAENLSADTSRVAVFNLKSTGGQFNFLTAMTVSQKAAEPILNCDKTSLDFLASGGEATVSVTSNVKWNATCSSDWIKLSAKGQTLTVKTERNTDQLSRSATIAVNGGSLARTISVVQKGAVALVEVTIETEACGETKSVAIHVDDTWNAKTSSSWISVSPVKGEAGDHVVSVTTLQNTEVSERSDYVYIEVDKQNAYEIKVMQKGLHLDCSPKSLFFYKSGGSESVAIDSNTTWKVASKPEWITTTKEEESLEVKAKVNNTGQPRTGTLVLCSTVNASLKVSVDVEQSKYSEEELVDPEKLIIPISHEGGSASLNVLARSAWTSEVKQSWLSRTPASGDGPATMTVIAEENNDTISRQGELIVKSSVKSNNYSNSVIIEQGSKLFRINSSVFENIPSTGQNVSVTIYANEGWQVTSKPSWITTSPSSGSGTDVLTLTIKDNPSANAREGQVKVKSEKSKIVWAINVQQNGRYLEVSPKELNFTAQSGTQSLVVTTDGVVEFSDIPDWIQITNSGNVYNVQCQENKNPDERQATITVSLKDLTSGSLSETVTIKQGGTNYFLYVSPQSIDCSSSSCKQKASVTTNDSWKIETKPAWITASVSQGDGLSETELTISDNNTASERTDKVVFWGKNSNLRDTIIVSQRGRYLEVSPKSLTFSSSQTTAQEVSVSTDGTYEATASASWIKVTQKNDSVLNVKVEEYHATAQRSGTVTVKLKGLSSGSKSESVTVTQNGVNGGITVTPSDISVSYSAATKDVTVTTQETWSLTKDANWITSNVTSGTGNKSVRLSISENNTPSERTGQVIFTTGSNSCDTVVVKQTGRNLTCTPTSLSFTKTGGSKTITVTADGSYSATSSDDWLTVSQNGNKVTVTASAATMAETRNGKVTLALTGLSSGSKSIEVSVSQDGVASGITLSQEEIHYYWEKQTKSIMVTTEEQWEATTDVNWLSLSPSEATGSKTVKITVSEHNATGSRYATVTFTTASGSTASISVMQYGRDISVVDPESLSFTKEGGSKKVNVTADGSYMATSSNESWLTASVNGSVVTVTATANHSESRKDSIILSLTGLESGSYTKTIVVTQEKGVTEGISLSASEANFYWEAQSKNVYVTTEEQWGATTDVSWLSLSPDGATGNKMVKLTVTENNVDNPNGKRYATVTFTTVSGKTASVSVMQYGRDISEIDPESLSFAKNGGSKTVNVTADGTYKATPDVSWLTATVNGSVVTVKATENSQTSTRTGKIALELTGLSSGSYVRYVTVTQSGGTDIDFEDFDSDKNMD